MAATRSSRAPVKSTVPKAPSTPAVRHTVPLSHILASVARQGSIPAQWLPHVLALVKEQSRIGVKRSPHRLSNLEAVVTSKGMARAEEIRNAGGKKLGQVVEAFDKTTAEIATAEEERGSLPDHPVVGANGHLLTAAEAETRMSVLRGTVANETDQGSLKHRRVATWLRWFALLGMAADFVVLTYFLGNVFNVDWNGLTGGDVAIVPLLTSLVFAILGTAVVAIGLHFFGSDLRGYKDDRGHLRLPTGKAKTMPLLFVALSVTVAIGAGVVMAYRIVTDSNEAGTGGLGGMLLGAFFAVIALALAVVIFSVTYRDGSTVTEELDHLTKQLLPIRRRKQQLNRTIAQLTTRLDVLRQSGIRIYDATLAKMSGPLKAADQLILQARSYHQGSGWDAEIVAPQVDPLHGLVLPLVTVDTSALDAAIEHLRAVEDTTGKHAQGTGVEA